MSYGDAYVQALAKIVLGIIRRSTDIDYRALYWGTVLSSNGNRADVEPDNPDLGPRLSNCRIARGDGVTSIPTSKTRCLIGWDGYDPSKRFIITAFDGNGTVDTIETATDTSITFLTPKTIADKDLVSEHEVGKSAGALSSTMGTNVVAVFATGDDTAQNIDITIDPMNPASGDICTVTFGRELVSTAKVVIQLKDISPPPPSPITFTYRSTSTTWTLQATTIAQATTLTVVAFIRANQ